MRSNYLLARLDMCGIRRARCQNLDLESITEDVLNLSVSDDPRSTTCSNSVGN
ncbi:hypothetical protein Syun_020467 [Stephania yunnanensis]|uniref:Uncharacterized protein n=1 Tax=Stephania yunnanensis TaxID=152371 RepID=A0AAP0IEJ2_9MAGN